MIDVLVPCLGRPESIPRLKRSLRDSRADASLLFIASPNDPLVHDACVENRVTFLVVDWRPTRSDYARKMNHAYRETSGEWLLLGAQDIHFHKGWDVAALECAERSGKRVIGTNDLGNPESRRTQGFSTHPLIHRSYVQEHGTIDRPDLMVSEAYDHNWCDRELAETAALRNEWHYCKASVVEHLHFHWGKGETDATYKKGLKNFGRDRAIYQRRARMWGGRPARLGRRGR